MNKQGAAAPEGQDPQLLAERARALSQAGEWDAAALELRQALATRPSSTFYARTQRLIDEVAGHAPGKLRQARIAVLGSSTTSLLIPVLRALCFRDGIDAVFHEGAFGAFRQEILERDGVLAAFRPTVVIIAPHWRDSSSPRSVQTIFPQRSRRLSMNTARCGPRRTPPRAATSSSTRSTCRPTTAPGFCRSSFRRGGAA